MTNEEAVKILRRIQEPEAWEPQINGAAFEALDMAIEALGRQQAAGSEELIGKQAAITALAFAKETGTMKCGELKGVIEVLNRLPSEEPPIIRCKDCKHYKYGMCMKICANKSTNGFCDWGERRQHDTLR